MNLTAETGEKHEVIFSQPSHCIESLVIPSSLIITLQSHPQISRLAASYPLKN